MDDCLLLYADKSKYRSMFLVRQFLRITFKLFSMKSFPADTLKKHQKEVLDDIEEITEEVLEEKLEKLEKAKT
jgi:hypothetical protein